MKGARLETVPHVTRLLLYMPCGIAFQLFAMGRSTHYDLGSHALAPWSGVDDALDLYGVDVPTPAAAKCRCTCAGICATAATPIDGVTGVVIQGRGSIVHGVASPIL